MADANIQTNSKTKQKYFVVTSPVITSAAAQNLICTFDNDATVYHVKQNLFYAYDKTAVRFTSISPSISEVSQLALSSSAQSI